MHLLAALAVLLLLYVLLELKTSRPDGALISVHPYRRLMAFIMPTRNESVVYFDSAIDAEALLRFVEAREGVTLTHCIIAAADRALAQTPEMNRFVMGGRTYQRKGRAITFSMKRKKLDKAAKLAVVKLSMQDGEGFRELCGRIDAAVNRERSGEETYADREFALFNALPRAVLYAAVPVLRFLDHRNLLPAFFIEGDGMYTSLFLANLGTLGMGAGFHHLYEWGNCPLFMMVGAVEERAVVREGAVVVRKVLPIRYSYDERIDDGLTARHGIEVVKQILEAPERHL